MNRSERVRETVSHPRRGFSTAAWFLWVLASALGGAVGGVTILGLGVVFGAAQAPILGRYLPRETVAPWVFVWVLASSLGWVAGWLVAASVINPLTWLVASDAQGSGIDYISTATQASPVVVWAVLGASQGAAFLISRRRWSPPTSLAAPWASGLWVPALWTLAGLVAAAPVLGASFYLGPFAVGFVPGSGGLYPAVVGNAAAGALYGAVTGVVLAAIFQRPASPTVAGDEIGSPAARRGGSWRLLLLAAVFLIALFSCVVWLAGRSPSDRSPSGPARASAISDTDSQSSTPWTAQRSPPSETEQMSLRPSVYLHGIKRSKPTDLATAGGLCRVLGDRCTRVSVRLLAVPRHGYTGFLMFGPTRCPRCSSRDTVKIVYGAVTPRRQLQAAAGQIRLGGAASDPERPTGIAERAATNGRRPSAGR